MGDLGARVADRLADVVTRATISARERMTPHAVRTGMSLQEEFFRLTGMEVAKTVGPFWRTIAEQPDAPDWVKATGNFIADGKGQWATLLAGSVSGMVLGSALSDLMANEMNPILRPLIALNPHGIFTPNDAAIMVARGHGDRGKMTDDAMMGGLGAERFQQLIAANSTYLNLGEVLILVNRGELSEELAHRLLTHAGYGHDTIEWALKLRYQPLLASELAAMWNRSIVTTDEGVALAARVGVEREDFMRLIELGGEPPPPELLYTAFRRGIIDRARLQRGIVQGPIRNEWFDVLEAMTLHSMVPEQAAGAVTQGHMSQARGREIAHEYGLRPEDFDVLIETSGLPPGIEFASEAYNRGFITDDEFGAMFLESRIKNRYLPLLRTMRTRLMPQETARSMFAKGVMTRERLATTLAGHGYNAEDIETFIAAASVEKTAVTRDLSLSLTRELYAEREIDADQAGEMLAALGYDETEAAFILFLTDTARLRTFRNAILTRIRSGVVAGLMSNEDATLQMDSIGVPPDRRDDLLLLWSIETSTVTRNLTPAQVVNAAKKELISPQAALARLVGQGYADEDARILLALSNVQA